jgi:ligand-binding sensor domain-containing protein
VKLGLISVSRLALALALFVPTVAGASETKAWTDLEDARACEPLEDGSFAVVSGGGLAVIAKDGRVQALTSFDGLPDTRVHALARDGDLLWVGTERGVAIVSMTPTLVVRRSLPTPDSPVHALLTTPSGVFLGTWAHGLWRVASAGGTAEPVVSESSGKRVTALALHDGSLYVAYEDGPLGRLENQVVRNVAAGRTHGQALLSTGAGDEAALLLGDIEGLFRIRGATTSVASVDTRALASVGPRILVGTYGSGLLSATERGVLRKEEGVPRLVRGIGVRGSMQCAATSEGTFVRDTQSPWTKLALAGPPSNDVTALAANGARVAIGTFDAGAVIAEAGSVRRVPGVDPTESVNAVTWQPERIRDGKAEGDGARLLLGTARGLVRVEPDGSVRRFGVKDGLPSTVVRALLVLDGDRLLVGTDDGLAVVDGDRVTASFKGTKNGPRTLASPMRATWALAKGSDGTLYIGTTAGLYYGKAGQFRRAALATGELSDDWVTSLAVLGTDVFAGTYSGGVIRLRIEGDHVATEPLGGGYINPGGLSVDHGILYAATMDGLLVRPLADEHAAWQLRNELSPGRDVTAALVVGDRLWVASRRGIGLSPRL